MDAQRKTVNVAIIEDDESAKQTLCAALDKFGQACGMDFCKHCFSLSLEFLDNYGGDYDIVFMDIQLPDYDGMSAAKRLREKDKSVVLVFVTNFAQYAINGYEVDAADFLVKPVEYAHFETKMTRIISQINMCDVVLPIKTYDGSVVSIAASLLKYVEVMGHGLTYHTTFGDFGAYGTLYKAEERLKPAKFVRCNSCYLVNPRYVESVNNFTTTVGGDELKISYAKRKEYRRAIAEYLGGLV